MNTKFSRLGWLAAIVVAFVGLPMKTAAGQTGVAPPDSLIAAAREIMAAAKYCSLVTLDAEGGPVARTMDPFEPENDMTVWFGTNRNSRKARQIEADPRVALHYTDPSGRGYVMITGTARIVDDEAEKKKRWKSEWEAFYADREAEYVLIEVKPIRMEVVDYAHGIIGDPATWTAPSVTFPRAN